MECSFDVVLIESSSELFTCSLDVGEVDFLVWSGFFFCYICCSFFSSVVLFKVPLRVWLFSVFGNFLLL